MEPVNENFNNERNITPYERTHETRKKSKVWIYILIPVVLIAAIWIWKEIQIRNLRSKAEKDMISLKQKAKQQLVQTQVHHLRLLAKPFVWSIRSEMLQGNLSQVHLYLNEMIKEKNFRNIMVANDKGVIVSSTNKKFEGQPFTTLGKESYLSTNTTIVENTNDSLLTLSSPIMGFNNRLGTLMLTYTLSPTTLK